MKKLNTSHLYFTRSERDGIIFLVLLILSLGGVYYLVDFSQPSNLDTNSSSLLKLQRELDSIRSIQLEAKQPKIYPFNPNFLTDYRAYTLGIPADAVDKLTAFRAQNKWVNSARQFQEVTGISDSLLLVIEPYFKFPEWVNRPKPKIRFSKPRYIEVSAEKKIDLNVATAEMLERVPGIGKTYSKRIVSYREKIGGFAAIEQLFEVWGLRAEVIEKVSYQFAVKTPVHFEKMNVNTASASDMATINGISFELAKKIWEFRVLRERLDSLDELDKIEGLSPQKLARIKVYLLAE